MDKVSRYEVRVQIIGMCEFNFSTFFSKQNLYKLTVKCCDKIMYSCLDNTKLKHVHFIHNNGCSRWPLPSFEELHIPNIVSFIIIFVTGGAF